MLDALRQPLEAGECMIARANHRVTYPARFQLVAAMNPCQCGMAGEPGHSCERGDACAADYQARISGPFLDRIDLRIDVPAVIGADLIRPAGPSRAPPSPRAWLARATIQQERFERLGAGAASHQRALPDGADRGDGRRPTPAGWRCCATPAKS